MEIKCKHKNILDEIRKRDSSISAILDTEIEPLIRADAGGQYVFDLCQDVLVALGYVEKVKLNKSFLDGEQQTPFVKVY